MKLRNAAFFLWLVFFMPALYPHLSGVQAQVIQLNQDETQIILTGKSHDNFSFRNTISQIRSFDVKTDAGNFSQITIDGYGYSKSIGDPQLPVLRKLIEIPPEARVSIHISYESYQEFYLADYGITSQIIPAQPSVSKSDDPQQIPFNYNPVAYAANQYNRQDLAEISYLGQMRGLNIARLDVAPVQYNPVQNTLKVYDDLIVTVNFENATVPDGFHFSETRSNRYFKGLNQLIFNAFDADAEGFLGEETITYIIVSDPMFQEALEPFVLWKQKKGFRVVTAYTNNPEVGNTAASIKTYLENFYNNPPQGYNPQTFVLIAGDIDQVPSFEGTTGNHATDLYYCEYTGDHFPEAFYGRFSANNIDEFQSQIDKTLTYEQFAFPDPSFLDEVVMVAGHDAYYGQIWANGQINYGTEYYFNAANNLISHTFLQPEPTGANYAQEIRQNISNGAAYANYTAHCSAQGWANPTFLINHINALDNAHKYPLMVGNCCTSVDFRITCFGEELLRAPSKGAIGYIGGSNNTYWDEDFWWSVGFKTISANPQYNAENQGMYDRLFQAGQNPAAGERYVTQGQMTQSGNLAVSQSGSGREVYYWEIYHLMGDPSLMVYFSQPDETYVSIPGVLIPGASSLTINTEPHAYVAISHNGVLHGTALANHDGIAEVVFDVPITVPGVADIVITGQNLKPFTGTIDVITPEGPWVLVQHHFVNDSQFNGNGLAEFAETISLDLTLKNFGTEMAENIMLRLSCNDEYVAINQETAFLASIDPDETALLTGIFEIAIAPDIPDEHKIEFDLEIEDSSNTWQSSFIITGHAPDLAVKGFTISDPDGNGNGKLEAGENAEISLMIENYGSADALNVMGELVSATDYITVNGMQFSAFGHVSAGASATATFQVTANEATPPGQIVLFLLNLHASGGAAFTDEFTIVVGQIPVLIVDLDLNKSSATAIFDDLNHLGVAAEFAELLPEELSLYSSIFVCLGVYNENYKLSPAEGERLATYLTNGGRIYMEGGDTWFYDPETAVHPMFGIEATGDGANDLGTIAGLSGTFSEGMTFDYTGENNWIDRLVTTGTAFEILKNQSPAYSCGIANENENYKTIGVSFEYSGLDQGNRIALLNEYLRFFNINGASALSTGITAEPAIICQGDSTQIMAMVYGGSGNYTFAWSPAAYLNNPEINNPVATPATSTLFTVVITDLISEEQITQTIMIEVLPVPAAPTIMQIGENLVSSIQFGNQWFGEDGPIPGATAQVFKPGEEGNYYSKIISNNGCDSDSSNLIYYQPTYIEELMKQGAVKVYPNPANGLINIDFVTQNSDRMEINVLNGFGQTVYTETFHHLSRIGINKISIDLSSLESGVYVLKLQEAERLISRKLLITD